MDAWEHELVVLEAVVLPPEALAQPASPAAVTAASAAASTESRMVQPPYRSGREHAPGDPLAGQPTGPRRPAQALSGEVTLNVVDVTLRGRQRAAQPLPWHIDRAATPAMAHRPASACPEPWAG